MYASRAWSSASTPTDAVTPGGQVRVSSGSTIATDGRRYWCETPVFVPNRGKSTTATVVTSDPVPEVVGTATRGSTGPGTCLPRPIGALTKSSSSPSCVAKSAQSFAVSRAEPPPIPTKPSKPSRAASAASPTEVSLGSPAMRS